MPKIMSQLAELSITGLRNGQLTFHQNNEDGSAATTRTVTHTLYGLDGTLTHTFAGTADQEEQWRVYAPRTYTINARLIANGNDEGSDTLNYTITDLNADQSQTTHTLTFTTSQGSHTQDILISYVANDSLYGGPGHTLRVEITQLADNVNFDIDHVLMSVTYDTTEDVPATDNTYSIVDSGASLIHGRLNRVMLEFKRNPTTDDVEILYNINGSISGIITDTRYDIFRFRWDGFRLNNNADTVMQNVQGFSWNTDLDDSELATEENFQVWSQHHDQKDTTYVWDNVSAPLRDVEAIRFPEQVNFSNLILEDLNNNNTYHITIRDGVLTPVLIVPS